MPFESPPEVADRELREAQTSEMPTRRSRQAMLGLVIAAAAVDAFVPPVLRMLEENSLGNETLELLLMPAVGGVFGGEIGAMACWLVWAPGSFLRRLVVHWSLGIGIGLCLFCGVLLASGYMDYQSQIQMIFQGAAYVGCVLPAVSLAMQLPLWPFRTHLGWRVAARDDVGAHTRHALSILDILIGTAVVALSLGLIRFLPGGRQN